MLPVNIKKLFFGATIAITSFSLSGCFEAAPKRQAQAQAQEVEIPFKKEFIGQYPVVTIPENNAITYNGMTFEIVPLKAPEIRIGYTESYKRYKKGEDNYSDLFKDGVASNGKTSDFSISPYPVYLKYILTPNFLTKENYLLEDYTPKFGLKVTNNSKTTRDLGKTTVFAQNIKSGMYASHYDLQNAIFSPGSSRTFDLKFYINEEDGEKTYVSILKLPNVKEGDEIGWTIGSSKKTIKAMAYEETFFPRMYYSQHAEEMLHPRRSRFASVFAARVAKGEHPFDRYLRQHPRKQSSSKESQPL